MAKPEFEQRPKPENGNIRFANSAELMRDNPAALIVNKESYDRMAGNFTYGPDGQFDPPQIVKVIAFSSEHGEVIKDFVLDGMTRTKFVYDNSNNSKIIPPDFKFTVKDVTKSVLQNSAIVPPEEKIEAQQALTMLQYLRAVIPPTVEHSQIAPDRIAAHLINGWENMTGESLSKKYSALAALSLLSNLNISTDEALRKDLGKQQKLITEETIEERVRLQGALVEMAQIIMQTRLIKQEVAKSAFILVSTESPVIGGEREARKQIYGLLHAPEVERKLAEAFPSVGEREQMRDQLGQFISDSFRKVARAPHREETISVLSSALKDSYLTLNYVIEVFTSDNPAKRYDEVREEINRNKLSNAYRTMNRLSELSATEEQLIDNIGRQPLLTDANALGSIRAVKVAETTLRQAEQYAGQLAAKRDELTATGVNLQLLDQAMPRIQVARDGVFSATCLRDITKKTQELTDTLNEIDRRIKTQTTIFKIGQMVDQMAGDKLQEGYGLQARSDMIGLAIGEFRTLTDQNIAQVRQRVKELTSLDHDLLLRVKSGDIRLVVALQRQKEKARKPKMPVIPTPTTTEEDQFTFPTAAPRQPSARMDLGVSFAPPVAVEPPVKPSSPEETVVDKAKLEERRKQANREKLNMLLDSVNKRLEDIDLEAQDITDAERERLNMVIRKLGILAFGHPNTPNVMLKEYPELRERVKKLQSQAVYQKIEEAQKDARTKQ